MRQAIAKNVMLRNIVMKNPVSLAFEDFFGLLLHFLRTKKLYLNRISSINGANTVTNGKYI